MSLPYLARQMWITCSAVLLMTGSSAFAVMDPRFELDSQVLEKSGAVQGTAQKAKKNLRARSVRSGSSAALRGTIHTVKAGDNLFKVLMRDYGLSNDEAEAVVEEIRRENNIYDIRRLKVGQRLVIPPLRRRADGTLKSGLFERAARTQSDAVAAQPGVSAQTLRLEAPEERVIDQDVSAQLKEIWQKLVPAKGEKQKPLVLQSSDFSLTLDPQRYPIFETMDGGRIVVDQGGTIPPLVRSLISEKDSSIHIVSEPSGNNRRLLATMLESGGFYSVEEDFNLEFGADPKVTVHSDFKVEKAADSLIRQDVVLMNSSTQPLPAALPAFLKKEGFSVFEPFAMAKPFMARSPMRQVHLVAGKNQPAVVDTILSALAVTYTADRRVDVFAADNNGISLSVKAGRYFEHGGQRYVISNFDGDPVTYTLFRILEAKGFRVVILDAKDDYRRISEKIMSRMQLQGGYSQLTRLSDDTQNYSLQMSGVLMEGTSVPGGSLFITNLELSRLVRDLLNENGYQVISR